MGQEQVFDGLTSPFGMSKLSHMLIENLSEFSETKLSTEIKISRACQINIKLVQKTTTLAGRQPSRKQQKQHLKKGVFFHIRSRVKVKTTKSKLNMVICERSCHNECTWDI